MAGTRDDTVEIGSYAQASLRIAQIGAGATAATGFVLLVGIVTLIQGPKPPDQPLQHALYCLAVAIPILVLSVFLAALEVAGTFAYFLLYVGSYLLNLAIYQTLVHTYERAANVYITASTLCYVLIIVVGTAKSRTPRNRTRT